MRATSGIRRGLVLALVLFIATLFGACAPAAVDGASGAERVERGDPRSDYLDPAIVVPVSLRGTGEWKCDEDIEFFRDTVDEHRFDNGSFCFEYEGDRDDIMAELASVAHAAGYATTKEGVSSKGLGLQLFEAERAGRLERMLGVASRPNGDEVLVTLFYMGLPASRS